MCVTASAAINKIYEIRVTRSGVKVQIFGALVSNFEHNNQNKCGSVIHVKYFS